MNVSGVVTCTSPTRSLQHCERNQRIPFEYKFLQCRGLELVTSEGGQKDQALDIRLAITLA